MELKGNWSLFFEDPATGEKQTIPAQVPGNVIGDLHRAGVIPDPFFGSNSVALRKYEFADWTYKTTFVPPEYAPGERLQLTLDGVDTVLSGMSTMEQMQDNTALMKDFQALSDEELKTLGRLRAFLHQNPQVECTGCGYCLGECPMKLPIPGFIRLLNNTRIFGDLPQIRNRYKMLAEQLSPGDCANCGCCTGVCPQHLDIPYHLSCLAKWAKEKAL